MHVESQRGMPSDVKGNPHYTDMESESVELFKVQLKQRIDTLEDELADAEKRLEAAKTDELIDSEAVQTLVDDLKGDLEEAIEEWDQKFGPETSH